MTTSPVEKAILDRINVLQRESQTLEGERRRLERSVNRQRENLALSEEKLARLNGDDGELKELIKFATDQGWEVPEHDPWLEDVLMEMGFDDDEFVDDEDWPTEKEAREIIKEHGKELRKLDPPRASSRIEKIYLDERD